VLDSVRDYLANRLLGVYFIGEKSLIDTAVAKNYQHKQVIFWYRCFNDGLVPSKLFD
jgi:hypothetical protein